VKGIMWNFKNLFRRETVFCHRTILAGSTMKFFCFNVVSAPMADTQIAMKRRMHRKLFGENDVEIRIARALPDFALPARFEKADVIKNLNQIAAIAFATAGRSRFCRRLCGR